jgi:hypothetical protein
MSSEDVLPLVYNALESDHAIVQERALKVVPDLCETIDYAEVQGVLFPRVAVCRTSPLYYRFLMTVDAAGLHPHSNSQCKGQHLSVFP